jgi:hypothetical protein
VAYQAKALALAEVDSNQPEELGFLEEVFLVPDTDPFAERVDTALEPVRDIDRFAVQGRQDIGPDRPADQDKHRGRPHKY